MSEIRIQKNETEELQKKDAGADFESFRQIIETLRSENGCPWDRAPFKIQWNTICIT